MYLHKKIDLHNKTAFCEALEKNNIFPLRTNLLAIQCQADTTVNFRKTMLRNIEDIASICAYKTKTWKSRVDMPIQALRANYQQPVLLVLTLMRYLMVQ